MPVGVLEALASGAPVAAAASGGLAETIVDKVNGVLFPPGDVEALASAIAALKNDRPLRDRLAGGARASARPYAIGASADRYAALLHACVNGANR